MKSIKQLNMDIINITMKIHQDYPELSKYIKEVPVKGISMCKDVTADNLVDYFNSLNTMLKKYADTHICKTQQRKLLVAPLPPNTLDMLNQKIFTLTR